MVEWTHPGSDPLYMIVGVLIWQDATVSSTSTTGEKSDVDVSLPLGVAGSAIIASQTGAVVPSEAIGDILVKQAKEKAQITERSAVSTESRIFAVQYRIVRRRKRNIFKRSPPILESRGPRVVGGRMYAVAGDESPKDLNSRKEDMANAILEMDSNGVSWTDALEQLQDKPKVDIIEANGNELSLSFVYDL